MPPASALLVAVMAYLLGSLVAGVVYSRARGGDIRERDLPGGSGTYRQFGKAAAFIVTVADILKAVLALWLAQWLAPGWTWLATFAVVLGHCYPVWFRFQGGGGIAPFLGALLVTAPLTILGVVALALAIIPVYRATLQRRLRLNAIPFATALTVPLGVFLALRFGGLPDLLAGAVAMAVRAVHLLVQPPARPPAADPRDPSARDLSAGPKDA